MLINLHIILGIKRSQDFPGGVAGRETVESGRRRVPASRSMADILPEALFEGPLVRPLLACKLKNLSLMHAAFWPSVDFVFKGLQGDTKDWPTA
eukprot:1161704-Pelagomonas_calceolata.AAC.2